MRPLLYLRFISLTDATRVLAHFPVINRSLTKLSSRWNQGGQPPNCTFARLSNALHGCLLLIYLTLTNPPAPDTSSKETTFFTAGSPYESQALGKTLQNTLIYRRDSIVSSKPPELLRSTISRLISSADLVAIRFARMCKHS